jgi:hypothetical protein
VVSPPSWLRKERGWLAPPPYLRRGRGWLAPLLAKEGMASFPSLLKEGKGVVSNLIIIPKFNLGTVINTTPPPDSLNFAIISVCHIPQVNVKLPPQQRHSLLANEATFGESF